MPFSLQDGLPATDDTQLPSPYWQAQVVSAFSAVRQVREIGGSASRIRRGCCLHGNGADIGRLFISGVWTLYQTSVKFDVLE